MVSLKLSLFLFAGTAAARSKQFSLSGLRQPKMVRRTGLAEVEHNIPGKGSYVVEYDTVGIDDKNIVDMTSLAGLTTAACNIDKTSLLLTFTSTDPLDQFVDYLTKSGEFNFLVGGTQYYDVCGESNYNSGLTIRRVVGGSVPEDSQPNVLEVVTVPTRYDEIFSEATISLNNTNTKAYQGNASQYDKPVCVGVNTVKGGSCTDAKSPIELYQNKYLDVSCQDCFMAFETDVFMSMNIHHFKLQNIAGGFRSMSLNSAFVLAMNAQSPNWSAGIDKVLSIIPDTTILSFKIGLVPFRLHFAVPVHVKADATLHAAAAAQAGVNMQLALGDLYVSWDPNNDWVVHKPSPKFTVTPVIAGSATVNAEASFSVVPSVTMMIDNAFTYGITFTPNLDVTASGDAASKKICLNTDYSFDISHYAQFDLNLDWVVLHKEIKRTFGPEALYSSGPRSLPQYCIGV